MFSLVNIDLSENSISDVSQNSIQVGSAYVTSLEQLFSPCSRIADGNRLATSSSNKTLFVTSCYHQCVKNLLRADDTTTC